MNSIGANWSTGSRLQILTAVQEDNDINSLFLIKEGDGYKTCKTGENILCEYCLNSEDSLGIYQGRAPIYDNEFVFIHLCCFP